MILGLKITPLCSDRQIGVNDALQRDDSGSIDPGEGRLYAATPQGWMPA